jgi:hypothetical protein
MIDWNSSHLTFQSVVYSVTYFFRTPKASSVGVSCAYQMLSTDSSLGDVPDLCRPSVKELPTMPFADFCNAIRVHC